MYFNCCFNPKHLVCKDRINLKCKLNENVSFYACSSCFLREADYSGTYKCKSCEQEHKKDLSEEKQEINSLSSIMNKELLTKLIDLSNKAKQELKDKVEIKSRRRVLDNLIDYLEQDIIVRVESIKFDLDEMGFELVQKIDNYKNIRTESIHKCINKLEELKQKNQNIKKLKQVEKCKKIQSNISRVEKFQNLNLLKLNLNTDDKSKLSSTKLRSLRNVSCLPIKPMIGFLYGPVSQLTIEKKLKLKPSVTIVDLSAFLKSSCGLTEIFNPTIGSSSSYKSQIAITDYASNDIKFISKFESHSLKEIDITSIDKFRLNKFKCYYAICSDYQLNSFTYLNKDYGNLYACDMELHRVMIFDQKMNKLKKIITGVWNEKNGITEEFECPRDICYYNKNFYVLDQGKNVINIFSQRGDFVENFYFNKNQIKSIRNPWSVRVCSDTIAIVDWKERVFIYDFNFRLKWILDQKDAVSICLIGNYSNKADLKLFVHCENGDFVGYDLSIDNSIQPILILKENFKELKYRSEFMIYSSNQRFILSLGWAKSIVIIEF